MKKIKPKLLLSLFFVAILLCISSNQKASTDWENRTFSERELSNLIALSKSYGYIRYFYPNPNLYNFNWDNFLYYAQKEIINSSSDETLLTKLTKVFQPICEEVRFSNDSVLTNRTLSIPYYINEHKAIGSFVNLKFRDKYTPIEKIENEIPTIHFKDQYSYSIGTALFITFPVALKELPAKSEELSQLETDLEKIRFSNIGLFKVTFGSKKAIQNSKKRYEYLFLRTADLMIRQNVINHFYPYYEEDGLEFTWDSTCRNTLQKVAQVTSLGEYYDFLKVLLGNVHDSHMALWNSFVIGSNTSTYVRTYNDDITVKFCGDTCYVDAVGPKFVNNVAYGDIILKVNDIPAQTLVDEKLKLISASTRANGLLRVKLFQTYKADSTIHITIQKADGRIDQIELNTKNDEKLNLPKPLKQAFFKQYDNGIAYVNLCSRDSTTYNNFKRIIPQLKNAKGIIMDVRGYPSYDVLSIISHFIKVDIMIGNLYTPIIRFPNRENVEYELCEKWGVAPAASIHSEEFSKKYEYVKPEPVNLNVPVVFLANAEAISFGETFLDMVKHYKVGKIIGEPTAGCNGDATHIDRQFATFIMTYNKFLNRDSSQHHGVGILPDIYCSPTIRDIRRKIDTQLEFARKYLTETGMRSVQYQ